MTQKELEKVLGTQGIKRVSGWTRVCIVCVMGSSARLVRCSTPTSTKLCSRCLWLRERSPTPSVRSSLLDTCSRSACCVLARLAFSWRRNKWELWFSLMSGMFLFRCLVWNESCDWMELGQLEGMVVCLGWQWEGWRRKEDKPSVCFQI